MLLSGTKWIMHYYLICRVASGLAHPGAGLWCWGLVAELVNMIICYSMFNEACRVYYAVVLLLTTISISNVVVFSV